jgi:hypothetical protein
MDRATALATSYRAQLLALLFIYKLHELGRRCVGHELEMTGGR